MPIKNTDRVLHFLPIANGAYGTGAGTNGVPVGTNTPVAIDNFRKTSTDFQSTLYKDQNTGRYTVAIAGSNNSGDWTGANVALSTANLSKAVGSNAWNSQMSDAVNFTFAAFRQIRDDYQARGERPPSFDDMRKMVDVTGHSLGGALSELVGKFFGIGGANIDGPGVSGLIGVPEYKALQAQVQKEFPDLKTDYPSDSTFGSYAYTVVGAAGTHISGIEKQQTPDAQIAEQALRFGITTGNPIAGLVGVGLALPTAAGHSVGAILERTKAAAGIASDEPPPPWHGADATDLDSSANLLASLGTKPITLADSGASTATDAPSTLEQALAAQKQDETARAAAWKTALEDKYGSDVSIVKLEDGTLVVVGKDNEPLGVVTLKDGEVVLNGFDASKTIMNDTGQSRVEAITAAPTDTPTTPPIDNSAINGLDLPSTTPTTTSDTLNNDSLQNPTYGGGDVNPNPNTPIISDDGYDPGTYIDSHDPTDVHSADAVNGSDLASDQATDLANLNTATTGLNLFNTLVNGLQNWDNASDLARIQTAVTLYNQLNSLNGMNMPNMGGVGAGLSLYSAIENGDYGSMVVSGVQLGNALSSSGMGVSQAIADTAIAQAIGLEAAQVVPVLGLIVSLVHAEENPLGVVIAAVSIACPVCGIFLAFAQIIATKSPVSVGEASATFDEAGNLIVNTDEDKNGGGSTANQWMQQLAHGAQLAGLQTPLAGAFAAGMPSVGYRYAPDELNNIDQDGKPINGYLTLNWTGQDGKAYSRHYLGNGESAGWGDMGDEGSMAEDFFELMQSSFELYPPLMYEQLDGGVLQLDYGVATMVHATNTQKYNGQAEHTHGGEEETDAAQDQAITIEASDKRLVQDNSQTVQNQSKQTHATVAASSLHTVVNPVIAPIQTKADLIDVGSGKIVSNGNNKPLGFVPLGGSYSLSQEKKNATAAMIQSAEGGPSGLFGVNNIASTAMAAAAIVQWPNLASAGTANTANPASTTERRYNASDLRPWDESNNSYTFDSSLGNQYNGSGQKTPETVRPTLTSQPMGQSNNVQQDIHTIDASQLQIGRIVGDAPSNASNGYLLPSSFNAADLTGAGADAFRQTGLSPDLILTAPKVTGELIVGTEDTGLRFSTDVLLSNDSTANAKAFGNQPSLRITSVGSPEHGQVALINGQVVFIPDANFHGTAKFSYTVMDQFGLSSTATASIFVESVNDAPVVAGESATASEGDIQLFNIAGLLANDYDDDGDALKITSVGQAEHGTVFLDANGEVRFVPDANYNGPASYTYWVSDGQLGVQAVPGTVQLNILQVNDLPVVTGETMASDEDVVLSIDPALLLANDSDVDTDAALNQAAGARQTLTISAVSGAQHGTVALLPDGTVQFTPELNYVGAASFNYTVDDGAGGQVQTTAVLNLAPVNDAPDVVGETININEDEIQTISTAALLANDSDVDNPHTDLKIVAVDSLGAATHGTVTLNANGTISYVPDANYFGPAQFTYTVSDGAGGFNVGTADLNIAAVNDAPTLQGESTTTDEDQILHISQANLLANDHDVDNPDSALSMTGVSNASHGTVAMVGNEVVFTPDLNYNGTASFSYTVSDGVGGTSTATVSLTINSVNDVPVVNDELALGKRDHAYTLTQTALLSNDTDVETPRANLTIVEIKNAQHGTATLNADHSVTFVPEAGYAGQGTFEYVVQDADGGQSTGKSYIDFSRVNVNPVAVDDSMAGYQDAFTQISTAQLLANDSDPDADGTTSLSVDMVNNAQNGTVSLGTDGMVRFTPNPGFYGTGSFNYRVNDGDGGTAWATGYVTVQKANSAPVFTSAWVEGHGPLNATHTTYDGGDTGTYSSTLIADSTRHWGGYSAYDPDGDAITYEIIYNGFLPDGTHFNTIGHIAKDYYVPDSAPDNLSAYELRNGGYAVASAGSLQYVMDFNSTYHGVDYFGILATDSHGARTMAYVAAFHQGANGGGGGCFPVAIDTMGDGIDLLKPEDSNMFADINKDGWRDQIGWVSSADAVLAFDANQDGKIDQGNEVSFTSYLPGAKTDLEGLAAFDTNGDGKLSNLDDQWSKFGLVQDANGNGKQDEGEFNGLDAQQIVSIDLNRQGSPELNNGNVVFGTATVTYADGHTTDAADVMFAGKGIALPTDVQALLAAENAKTAEREAAALIAAQEIAAKEAADKLAAEQLAIQQAKEAAEAAEALAAAQALEAQVQAEAAALAAAQQAALLQAAAEAAAKAEQEAALAAEAEIRRQALLFNQMANTSPADETPIAFVPNNDAVTGHVSDPSGAHLQAANDDQANTLTLVGTH